MMPIVNNKTSITKTVKLFAEGKKVRNTQWANSESYWHIKDEILLNNPKFRND